MKLQDIISICRMLDKRSKCCAVQLKAGHLVTLEWTWRLGDWWSEETGGLEETFENATPRHWFP